MTQEQEVRPATTKDAVLAVLVKFTSRKFLAALAVEVAGIIALFGYIDTGNAVADGIIRVGTLIGVILAALGYAVIEASVDKAALPEK